MNHHPCYSALSNSSHPAASALGRYSVGTDHGKTTGHSRTGTPWLPSGFLAAALMAGFVLSPATSRANLLANPGFESHSGNRATGWTWFGNAFCETNYMRGGTNSLKLFGNWSSPGNASGAYQTHPAFDGETWTFSGYGMHPSGDALVGANFALLKIVWFSGPNGTGTALQPLPGPGARFGDAPGIETVLLTNSTPTNVWHLLSASGSAPPGTVSVQLLVLFIQPNYEGGSAWFDDLSAVAWIQGFVNVPVYVGLNLIANPLNAQPDNYVSNVIHALPDGTAIYRFDPVTQAYNDAITYFAGVGWYGRSGDPADPALILAPGEAFWLESPQETYITFVGTLRIGSLTNALPNGCSLKSSMLPADGYFSSLGFPAEPNDEAWIYTHVGFQHYQFDEFDLVWYPMEPWLAAGEGAIFRLSRSRNWIQTYDPAPAAPQIMRNHESLNR